MTICIQAETLFFPVVNPLGIAKNETPWGNHEFSVIPEIASTTTVILSRPTRTTMALNSQVKKGAERSVRYLSKLIGHES